METSTVHIFWDHSNLFIRALDTCDDRHGGGREPGHRMDARLHFKNMLDFAASGRTIQRAVAVGSVPPGLQALWDMLGGNGVSVLLQERGAETGKEQAVDEVLKLEMLRSVLQRQQTQQPPAVAVLLSGDGGFLPELELMLSSGWGVEVLSFSNGFSTKLKTISTGHGGRGKYVVLDDWYEQVVYLQGLDEGILRRASPLNLAGRPHV